MNPLPKYQVYLNGGLNLATDSEERATKRYEHLLSMKKFQDRNKGWKVELIREVQE